MGSLLHATPRFANLQVRLECCLRASFYFDGIKGTPSIPETYLSSSVAWGLNLSVAWWRQILKKCKFSNQSSGPTRHCVSFKLFPCVVRPSPCGGEFHHACSFYFWPLLQAACNGDGASNTKTSRSTCFDCKWCRCNWKSFLWIDIR